MAGDSEYERFCSIRQTPAVAETKKLFDSERQCVCSELCGAHSAPHGAQAAKIP
jgi:hypothetical protein